MSKLPARFDKRGAFYLFLFAFTPLVDFLALCHVLGR